jgi:hypothetical protein
MLLQVVEPQPPLRAAQLQVLVQQDTMLAADLVQQLIAAVCSRP